jgi:hypothetical protein
LFIKAFYFDLKEIKWFILGFIFVSHCVIIKEVIHMDFKALIKLTRETKSTIKSFLNEQGIGYVKSKNAFNVYNETFFGVTPLSISFKLKGKHYNTIIVHQTYEDEVKAKATVEKLRIGLIEILGTPTSDNHKHHCENAFVTWDKDIYIQLNQTSELKRIYIYITPIQSRTYDPKKAVWIVSMIGGLIFGLAMYALMGIGFGYNVLNFIIQMLGGLVWGGLFGFFMNMSVQKNPIDPYKLNLTKRDQQLFETYSYGQTEVEGEQACLCSLQTKTGLQYFKTTIYFYNYKAVFAYIRRGKLYELTLPYANINLYMDNQDHKEVVVWLNNKTKLIIRNSNGLSILKERLDEILGYQETTYQVLEKYILDVLKTYDLMDFLAGGAPESILDYDVKSIARYLYKERPLDAGDVEQVLINYYQGLLIDSFEDLANLIFEFYTEI